ncbi:MAG: hypothetical protein NWF00_12830 [Candidatus Bathyarchaeota archaeon]|nr:hypothetical protein [Candidatus Bathyarchaeota archaeon]
MGEAKAVELLEVLVGWVKRFNSLRYADSFWVLQMVKHLFGLEEENCEDCDCDCECDDCEE